MPLLSRLVVMLALSASIVPAHAQQRSGQDIVVTGERETKERKEAVRTLTHAVSSPVDGQMARFADPVCPDSVGFEPQYGKMVIDNIARAARDAGIAVDKAGCRPNLTVMIVDNGQRELQALYKARPTLFGILRPDERRRLLADDGPVHVVMLTEVRDRDGERVQAKSATGTGGADAAPMLEVHSVSLMNPSTRQDINGSLVLIDRAAVMGKTLRQIADYAAMRTLAKTREAKPGDSSILTLFAKGGAVAPPGLTSFDRAYLKGLYTGPATRAYFSQAGSIASGINRAGASAKATEPAPQ